MNFFAKFFEWFKPAQEIHAPQEGYDNLAAAEFFRQIITADSRSSRTIMWNSSARLENVQLEYKMIGDDAASFGSVAADFFRGNFIYSCTLKNLKPESLYQFRVIAGDYASEWQNLRTAGDGEFEMLVFSDSQSFDYGTWRRTAEILTTGRIFCSGGSGTRRLKICCATGFWCRLWGTTSATTKTGGFASRAAI